MYADEAALEKDIEALEEKLDYSNVTDLRRTLPSVVERLQQKPALRCLIFKHGRPQAVLMSFHTYELLKKVMNQALGRVVGTSREEAIQAAFGRLRAERQPTQPRAAKVLEAGVVLGNSFSRRRFTLSKDLSRLDEIPESPAHPAGEPVEYSDKVLKCVECGAEFVFTGGEQMFFADKGFKNEPKRCKACKAKRAQNSVRAVVGALYKDLRRLDDILEEEAEQAPGATLAE